MSCCPKGCMNVLQQVNVRLLQFYICLDVAVPAIMGKSASEAMP